MSIDPAAYEGDIVSRLRHWRGLHLAHGGRLYEEAADEIERLRTAINTNHDAAPTAKARTDSAIGLPGSGHGSDGNDKPVTRPVLGIGDTQEPSAWLAYDADGSESSAVYMMREQADSAARTWGWQIAPLYQFPALWPEEEIAIEAAWERCGLRPTWPDDEPQTGVRCANAMADEILRLRLTDDEREAVKAAADFCESTCAPLPSSDQLLAIRDLLSRLT